MDADVRIEAVLALGIVGKAGVPGLITALKDKDADVRFQAVATIGKLGAEAKPAVKPLTERLDEGREQRGADEAAQMLGASRGGEGVAAVAEEGGEGGQERQRQGGGGGGGQADRAEAEVTTDLRPSPLYSGERGWG